MKFNHTSFCQTVIETSFPENKSNMTFMKIINIIVGKTACHPGMYTPNAVTRPPHIHSLQRNYICVNIIWLFKKLF